MMKFGIVGLGNHALNRVMPQIVEAGHEVSAVYSRSMEKAHEVAEKYSAKAFDDMNLFLNDDFDAVYIASPNFLHYQQTKDSLLHGKHVLLEKQMTLKTEHSEELVSLAKDKKLSLAIGFHMRFHPVLDEIRRMINSGELGTITYVHGNWSGYSSRAPKTPEHRWWDEEEKVGGGAIMATGVHVIDSLNYILGSSPSEVFALRLPRSEIIERTEHVTMKYGETIVTVLASRDITNPSNDLVVSGTKGSIVAQGVFGTSLVGRLIRDGETMKEYNGGNLYKLEIESFSDLVSGKETNIALGEDGYLVVKITNAAFDSDVAGKRVLL